VKSYENLSNFGFLPSTIKSLERSGARLVEHIAVVKTVVNNVDGFPGNTGKEVKEKLGKVFGKNMDYSILCSILDLLNRENFLLEETESELEFRDIVLFKYAPIVSVQVERSFCVTMYYKHLI
jgi:hypothetical protein